MFQPAVPVARVLTGIHRRDYVLPAIQREFVWGTDQVRALFDSLMRGYPIGAFLFWKVESENAGEFTFYNFITHYHERDNPYAPVAEVPADQGITAILDGQQRLTALNIGLYGSFAEKQPRKWRTNPDAFPKKRLYLNLLPEADSADEDLRLTYDFRFLRDDDARPKDGEPSRWYRVGEVLKLQDSGPAIMTELQERGLVGADPFNVLYTLYKAIRETNAINAYQEESQDPNKVLDIFVRVNSGGTTLSYSDLLLSMATNQWKDLDAREEVRSLVAELNDVGPGFQFSKDLVLKTGLVLIDVPDIGFKVSNFTQANMRKMEERWQEIRSALLTAADLLAAFGYSVRTLTASSVMIPLAYYLNHHGLGSSYVVSSQHAADRLIMKRWVDRSLMKRGIWGSGLDRFLSRLREAIAESDSTGFPIGRIESAMTSLGKSLTFETTEIDDLLDLKFGSSRIFPVLAMLYPGLDLSKSFHEDHVFPKSRFSRSKLTKAGVPVDRIDEYLDKVNRLPNLQLLGGGPNIEKQATMPAEWLRGPHFPTDDQRGAYVHANDLDGLPDELHGFLDFYARRRAAMERRLQSMLVPSEEDD